MIERDELYIGGAWVTPEAAGHIAVVNPATEDVIGRVPDTSIADVDAAVSAAQAAAPVWAATPPAERADALERLATRLDAQVPAVAELISREVGTPLPFSMLVQASLLPRLLRQYAQLVRDYQWDGRAGDSLLVHEPIGVVAAITPWNYPLTLTGYKLAPTLAAGCPVILKPSELAPLSAFLLADEVHEAGFPPGVFGLVTGGPAAGERLVSHPGVDMVSFTGSTATGAKVMAAAAADIKRVHLELGGKSPAVVLDDADLTQAVTATLQQAFMNSGQTCLAWTRMLVPATRQEEAVELLRRSVEESYVPGDPAAGAAIGPMVSRSQQARVEKLIETGIDKGARLVTGGPGLPDGIKQGFYVKPTVFADVRNDMTIAQDEIFGPVLCVIPYADEDEAIRIANDSPYGLHGAVFSTDPAHAAAVARRLQTGQIDVNGFNLNPMAPFGGYKQSGNGKELGVEGFEAFLETKSIQGLPPEALPAPA